jgi:sigma-B regulation protein RsbU (phosphoserine phosphatase)
MAGRVPFWFIEGRETPAVPPVTANPATNHERIEPRVAFMNEPKIPVAPARRPRILVSDDQPDILTALELLLKFNGYQIECVDSPQNALLTADARFDLALLDLNYTRDTTSGKEGLELLAELRRRFAMLPIVVMTAWGNVELAVEAMRLGASDFVQKPWDNTRLLETVKKGLDWAAATRRVAQAARSELDIARHVQEKLFPQILTPLATLDYAGRCVPARVVGGDYYDFFDEGSGRLAGVLADVSGKGVAAAMLMANLQALFRAQFEAGLDDAAEILITVNRLFHQASPSEQYVTLFYFDYNESTRLLRYANCGHPAPLLMRASGGEERLESTATVVGLFPKWKCETAITTLAPGDRVIAFTDGATDCVLESGEELGEDGFISLAREAQGNSASELVEDTLRKLATRGGGRDLVDDQTVVALLAR